MRVVGLVLAGGQSRRFGADKASQRLAGRPLLAWSLAALDGVCETVAVSAAPDSAAGVLAASLGRLTLSDDPAHAKGPLTGLAAGLKWAAAGGYDLLATLPCDTPLVGQSEIAALIAALGDASAAYAVTPEGPQSLCAIWLTSLYAGLTARLATGEHPPVRAFLDESGGREVRFDDPGPFTNVNSGKDLTRLARFFNPAQPKLTAPSPRS